jgi:hypothetical protein
MGSNIGFSVVKEFIPDLGRSIAKNRKTSVHAGSTQAPL